MSGNPNGPDSTTPKGNGRPEPSEVLDAVLVDDAPVNPLTMPVHICVTVIIILVGLLSLTFLYVAWPPKMAINLKGGVRLVYDVLDEDASIPDVIDALGQRINPGGIGDSVIRPHGEAIEVIVPDLPASELAAAKKLISTNGMLTFQIVANQRDHQMLWNRAEDPNQVDQNLVRDENGDVIGRWVKLSLDPRAAGEEPVYRADPQTAKTRLVGDRKEILMVTSEYDVDGTDLASARAGFRDITPCVFFDMSAQGARKMAAVTGGNLPDVSSGHYALLGIIMDDELISAPRINETISDHGIIEGQFTREEVELLVNVLRAGQLPAPLAETARVEESVPPDPSSWNLMRRIITIGLTGLLISWILLLFRHKWMGALAVLAGFAQPLLALALIVFVGISVSVFVAGIITAVALLVSLSNVVVCETIRRGRNTQKPAIITLALYGLLTAASVLTVPILYSLARSDLKSDVVVLLLVVFSAAILQTLWLIPGLAGLSSTPLSRLR